MEQSEREILDTRTWTTVTISYTIFCRHNIILMFNTQAKYHTLMLPNRKRKPQSDVSPPIFECRQLDVRFVWILFESMQHLGRASLIILQFFNRFYRIHFEIRFIISKWSNFRKQFLKNILIELDCLIVYFNLKHHRNNLEIFWWFFKCGLRRVYYSFSSYLNLFTFWRLWVSKNRQKCWIINSLPSCVRLQ